MKKLIAIAILLIATSAGAATATWTHDGLNMTNGGFTLWFYQTSTPAIVWNKSVTGATVRTMNLDDNYFAPGVEYSFYMTAYNAVGQSASSTAVKWTRPGTSFTPAADKLPTSLYLKPSGVNTIVIDITP